MIFFKILGDAHHNYEDTYDTIPIKVMVQKSRLVENKVVVVVKCGRDYNNHEHDCTRISSGEERGPADEESSEPQPAKGSSEPQPAEVSSGLRPIGGPSIFKLVNSTQETEDSYDTVKERNIHKPTGVAGSIAHMIKGALGSGILSTHVAYMDAGYLVALILNLILGIYMTHCLYILVKSAQILYRRTGVPQMSYSDVGEAAAACFPNPKVQRFAKVLRYGIDILICIDLFGACSTYQIIIAKTIKQLVENSQKSEIHALYAGYPHLRVYLAAICIPCILICLLRHLNWLAPFSMIGNVFIMVAIFVTIYYCAVNNPSLSDMKATKSFKGSFEFMGIVVFSMSCSGVVIAIENNMTDAHQYARVHFIAMFCVVFSIMLCSFCGYAAYLDDSDAPITMNFPMTMFSKILKGLIALMIYITHALNFWVPFNLCFHYIQKRHANSKNIVLWELFYRSVIVLAINLLAITFPSIGALMGFLGCFCLSFMSFIFPNTIEMLVNWERPGMGKYRWRFYKEVVCIIFGLILWSCGTYVSVEELIDTFKNS